MKTGAMKISGAIAVVAVMVILLFNLTVGSAGINHHLDTGHGIESFQASLKEATGKMDKAEIEAYDWAVDGLDLESLNKLYPNKSPKTIIRSETRKVLNDFPAKIAELEKKLPEYEPTMAQLNKISADNVTFSIQDDFFGLQPTITATIKNASSLGVSSLSWYAELFIDGDTEPIVTSKLFDNYSNQLIISTQFADGEAEKGGPEGLSPMTKRSRQFTVGFLTGAEKWSTIEIRKAKERRVRLTAIPETVKDFGNRYYLAGAPYAKIDNMKRDIRLAKKYSSI